MAGNWGLNGKKIDAAGTSTKLGGAQVGPSRRHSGEHGSHSHKRLETKRVPSSAEAWLQKAPVSQESDNHRSPKSGDKAAHCQTG